MTDENVIRTLLNSNAICFFEINPDFILLDVNKVAAKQLFCLSEKEILANSLMQLENSLKFDNNFYIKCRKVFESREAIYKMTFSVKSINLDRYIYLLIDLIPDEKFGNLLVLITDISEYKVQKDKVDRSLYYENVLNYVPSYIFWKDKNSTFLGCNNKFAETAKLANPDDIIGKTDYELPWGKGESDAYRLDDQDVISSGRPKLNILEPQTLEDGSQITLLTNKVPLYDKNEKIIGIVGIYNDVTVLKRTEEKLKFALEKAELSNKAKSEFIANMSHDIRTPITGILGLAQTIKNTTEQKSIASDSDLLIGSVKVLLNLLNQIMEMVELDSDESEIGDEIFSVRDLLNNLNLLLSPAAKDKSLLMTMNIDDALPSHFIGEGNKIERILINLVSNAIKFTDVGEINVAASFKYISEKKTMVIIKVSDTGIGIPSEKFEYIFENFSRLNPAYEGKYDGFGLGLYSVKKNLDAIGGEITVESELDVGTCFTVQLPLHVSSEPAVRNDPNIVHLRDLNSAHSVSDIIFHPNEDNPVKILIVEDNVLASRMAVDIFKGLHCKVESAITGNAALYMISRNKYDLILLDIGLPDISGLDVAKKITETKSFYSPIIALTGHVSEKFKQNALARGFNDIYTKPLVELQAKKILLEYVQSKVIYSIKRTKLEGDNSNIDDNDRELHELLITTVKEAMSDMNKQIISGDLDQMANTAHALYGALCYCNEPALRDSAKELERVLISNNKESFMPYYKKLVANIQSYLQNVSLKVID